MRVLLADDHKLVRDALAFYCSRLGDDVEVLQAETYDQAAELAAQAPSLDLIILDLNMPGSTGFDGLDSMRKRYPDIPIVILSGSIRHQDMSRALAHGANGYLPKTLGGDAMLNALRLVMSGKNLFPRRSMTKPAAQTKRAIFPPTARSETSPRARWMCWNI